MIGNFKAFLLAIFSCRGAACGDPQKLLKDQLTRIAASDAPTPVGRSMENPLRIRFGGWVLSWFLIALLASPALQAHHFKGLPHYNYFENYPQIPEEEFLGQSGRYEFSLVVYDFQGIDRSKMESPETVRLFLVVFNLESSGVYIGPATLDILDGDEVIYSERQESAELENLYSIHQGLPETGDFSLRVTLHGMGDLKCDIPFTLSSQKVHWGPWVAGSLFALIAVAAVGARRARVAQDRREAARRDRSRAKSEVAG